MTTFSAVVTTGIYCRPGCGAKPLAENVKTFELAAEAEAAGFRACLRCRPYRVAADGGLRLRLPFAPPWHWEALSTFLAERAVPGVESVHDGVYRRTISLDGEAGVIEVTRGGDDHLLLTAHMPFWEGLIHVV